LGKGEKIMGFWKWLGLSAWKRLRKIKRIHVTKEDFAIAKALVGIMGGIVVFVAGIPIAFLEFLFTSSFPIEFVIGCASISGLLFLIGLHGVYQIEVEDC